MRIAVHIYASLRPHLTAAGRSIWQKEWELPEEASVGDVVSRLKLPKEIQITVFVNSSNADERKALREGDVIHVLPQMSGG
jgi:molybdopterin converting factor small subunit